MSEELSEKRIIGFLIALSDLLQQLERFVAPYAGLLVDVLSRLMTRPGMRAYVPVSESVADEADVAEKTGKARKNEKTIITAIIKRLHGLLARFCHEDARALWTPVFATCMQSGRT